MTNASTGVLILPAYMSDYAHDIAKSVRAELGDRAPKVQVREPVPCDCEPFVATGSCEHGKSVVWKR